MSTALAVSELKSYLAKDKVKQVFEDMLGERAGAFINSVTNVTRNSTALQKCDPMTIIASAIDAASLNLAVDPGLGFAAIVPYKTKAQFQIMYKGITQLAIRSGQYKTIHCSEIYTDELLSHNPITGVVKFKDPATFKLRSKGLDKDVIGHYAYLRLTSGFEKSDYMSHAEAMAHGEKYSKAYQYDLRKKEKNCPWSTNPIAQCNKTVYLRLMKKYGILSIEMQTAIEKDNSFEAAQDAANEQIKDEQGSVEIEAEFEPKEGEKLTPQQKAAKTRAENKAKKEAAAKNAETAKDFVPPPESSEEFYYECLECGHKFNTPSVTGVGDDAKSCCPNMYNRDEKPCLSPNIKKLQE